MIAKFLVAISLLVAFASTSVIPAREDNEILLNRTTTPRNLIVGAREYGDRLVHQEQITKPSSLWQITTYEKTINIYGATKITELQALDERGDGTGASVTVLAGGPGVNFVTLRFKSQRNHGIHFQVLIYAK